MSVEPPYQDREYRPPIIYIPLGRAPAVWRPGTLAVAIARYGAAHGMVSPAVAARIEAAPASIAPIMPLSTTQSVVIAMKPPAPPPAPVEAAPPAAAAPVHIAPRGAGVGVHPV